MTPTASPWSLSVNQAAGAAVVPTVCSWPPSTAYAAVTAYSSTPLSGAGSVVGSTVRKRSVAVSDPVTLESLSVSTSVNVPPFSVANCTPPLPPAAETTNLR